MGEARDADELFLYRLEFQPPDGLSGLGGRDRVASATRRCALPGLQGVFEGDRGTYSFLAQGHLYVVAAPSEHHIRDTLCRINIRDCSMHIYNYSLRKNLNNDWTCIADRAGLLLDGVIHPLSALPAPVEVEAPPAGVPSGYGCHRHPQQGMYAQAEYQFRHVNQKCLGRLASSFTPDKSRGTCLEAAEAFASVCEEISGKLCKLTIRSGASLSWTRETVDCVPRACTVLDLHRLAQEDEVIYRWCPTLPLMSGQFLYQCRLQFSCSSTFRQNTTVSTITTATPTITPTPTANLSRGGAKPVFEAAGLVEPVPSTSGETPDTPHHFSILAGGTGLRAGF